MKIKKIRALSRTSLMALNNNIRSPVVSHLALGISYKQLQQNIKEAHSVFKSSATHVVVNIIVDSDISSICTNHNLLQLLMFFLVFFCSLCDVSHGCCAPHYILSLLLLMPCLISFTHKCVFPCLSISSLNVFVLCSLKCLTQFYDHLAYFFCVSLSRFPFCS